MQAAFLGRVVFPPPAPGPLRLARCDRTGAGLAADRDKAFVMQRIERDSFSLGETQRDLARPVEQGVELDQAALRFGLRERDAAARGRLVGAQAGDPDLRPVQGPAQWLDLADVAAGFAGVAGSRG